MPTVLLAGGTGLIGQALSKKLIKKGYDVAVLSRTNSNNSHIQSYMWNIDKNQIQDEAIETADFIVNLAGTNIGEKKWTTDRKNEIIASRVKSTNLIFEKIKDHDKKINAYISASAIGYYGAITSEKIHIETDHPSEDFLGTTCQKWEQSATQFDEIGIRTVKIRTGVVLSANGGGLEKMITPIKLGIGSAIGSGNQYMPWIHVDDLCEIYVKAIEDSQMNGAYNAVAPDFSTNYEFTKTLAQVLGKPLWFPKVPELLMKFIFGEMAEIILKGSRVSSEKIQHAGFRFQFPNLENALRDLIEEKE
ncbi:MAG: TIGR01777 family protein [Bacteroidetes bacterium GWF2_33_38]|nr:MAG: TIGR01777 family protein [Bacteroidetes bacterium GWF2_33_38]OFY74315.1 MAG: TIGR01777 family protein [Bacteroidetes bacterium RIFOXYA12_FULL_33_9]OFY90994.1 MAG: TIGR01777 family protein [Bacteroidetes bacterium RIFOXYA2_FULL_33_7]